jgi:hypothetical protein
MQGQIQSARPRPQEGSVGLNHGVGHDAALTPRARSRGKSPEISEPLRRIGWRGCAETAIRLQELKFLPPRRVEDRGAVLTAFGVGGVLARRPTLRLVLPTRTTVPMLFWTGASCRGVELPASSP